MSGFTVAREKVETPVDLPTWMASHSDVVLASKPTLAEQEIYDGPRETREYDIAKLIDRLSKETGSKDRGRKELAATLKQFYHLGQPGDEASGEHRSPEEIEGVGLGERPQTFVGVPQLARVQGRERLAADGLSQRCRDVVPQEAPRVFQSVHSYRVPSGRLGCSSGFVTPIGVTLMPEAPRCRTHPYPSGLPRAAQYRLLANALHPEATQ